MIKSRKIFRVLLDQKENRKISLLIGSRQVGKTTLLNTLYEEICTKNKTKGMYLDLDIFSNFEKISTFENLLNFCRINGYEEKQKEFFYLFLDEFQRYTDLTIILKNVYDNVSNIKIYASGSSSIKIKAAVQESLAGRKIINVVYPLDFEEFLGFKERKDLQLQLQRVNNLSGKNLQESTKELNVYLNEFLIFGGYPEVALKKTAEEKIEVLKSIFDLYIKKDIVEYLRIDKLMNVKKLIEFLSLNNAQKLKYEEITQVASLEYKEAVNYIEILKDTYLIILLRPMFKNKNKEIVKSSKIYFIDSGVRNFFINNFNPVNLRDDTGFLFEGYLISEFLKLGIEEDKIKYWQDKNKHEVDIIIENSAKTIIAIEAKFKTNLKNDDFLGLHAFLKEYTAKKTYLINLSTQIKQEQVMLKLPYDLKQVLEKQYS